MNRLVAPLVAAALLLGCAPATASNGPSAPTSSPAPQPSLAPSEPFDVADVVLRNPGGQTVDVPVYVADTPSKRARGLMQREDLPDGTGMVFVWPAPHRGAFYMYQTLIPLTIAFADAQGAIVAILDMPPCQSDDPAACERYDPGVEYQVALEVEQGYLAERGVTTEWTLELPAELDAAA